MSTEQPKPNHSKRNNIIFISVVIAGILSLYFFTPRTTLIEFIDASEDYVWVEKKFSSDLGSGFIWNYYNITIPNHEVRYDHHFYAQAFYNKTKEFCSKKPFEGCSLIMTDMINEGNFRQQAGELNMTMDNRISENCFDDGKFAFCKSPKDLEKHLVSKGVMNDTG